VFARGGHLGPPKSCIGAGLRFSANEILQQVRGGIAVFASKHLSRASTRQGLRETRTLQAGGPPVDRISTPKIRPKIENDHTHIRFAKTCAGVRLGLKVWF
jgi:hypothetical protein